LKFMRIFLSYEAKDALFVEQLAEAFNAEGVQCASVNLKVELGEGIFDLARLKRRLPYCEQAVVILSRAYAASDWLVGESLAFLLRERVTGSEFMLPVVIEDCEIPVHLKNRAFVDFRGRPFRDAFEQLLDRIVRPSQVFVSMMIGNKELDSAYELAIEPVIKKFRYEPIRVDRKPDSDNIADKILESILRSEVVIADLTGERPNCYYEVGYAHALSKKMILSVRKGSEVHFNLSGYQFIEWETENELKQGLTKHFQEIHRQQPPRKSRKRIKNP
jgi:hypothetical protein